MMVVGYQIDNGTKVGRRDVVHEVAGGKSMSRGREEQEVVACLMYRFKLQRCNQRIKEDGLWYWTRKKKRVCCYDRGAIRKAVLKNAGCRIQDRVQRAVTRIAAATLTYVYL